MGDREAVTGYPSGDASTGLPSRQPGSTLAQRGLATGADVAVRRALGPQHRRPHARAWRHAAPLAPHGAGRRPVRHGPAALAPAVPAAGSAFSDVTADETAETPDELASVTSLHEGPSTDEATD